MSLRVGELCAGYGGIFQALTTALDVELTWYAEHEPPTDKTPKPHNAAAKVLAHHYPGVPNLGDIVTADWATAAAVDILTAGFPCQDLSLAGKQSGMRGGNRSGLWFRIANIIDLVQPELVVIENVRGLLSAGADSDLEPCTWCVGNDPTVSLRALGCVLGDLADLGFDAEWCLLPASGVGAPHKRERVFLVAAPHTPSFGHKRSRSAWQWRSGSPDRHCHAVAHPEGVGWREGRPEPAGFVGGSDVALGGDASTDTDSATGRVQPIGIGGGGDPSELGHPVFASYGPAVERWERVLGRRAPAPTVLGNHGGQQLNPVFVEFLMGLPQGWVTDVRGLTRSDMLKALGNGVVPQQCAAALRHLLPRLFSTQAEEVAA